MKIAVTYENGNVFQHFGKTEAFKVYEVENGQILSAEVIGTEGAGHEALADFLAGKGVGTLICGGLGGGAQTALADAGIQVISGAQGVADDAVEAFLSGELASAGVNCDHHDHAEEESGCGGGCGGGCHRKPFIIGPNAGKTVEVHYRGTFADGTEFDSSYERGEPLRFVCGLGQVITGFDEAVANLALGESVDVHLTPDKAYGYPDPNAFFEVPIEQLPGSEELSAGEQVVLYDNDGRPHQVRVADRDDTKIVFDANNEMAGKELNFHIELLSAE